MFQKILELFFNLGVVLVISWFLWEARDWSFYSRLFPWSIGFVVLMLAIFQFGISLRTGLFGTSGGDDESKEDSLLPSGKEESDGVSGIRRAVAIICWIIVFFMGIWLLGFRLGSFILTVGFLKLAANESYKTCIPLGAVNYLFFLIIFDFALGVPLFQGAVANWVGIGSIDGFLAQALIQLWS